MIEPWQTRLACLSVVLATMMISSLSAQDTTASPSEKALGDTSWYDADRGSVVPIEVAPVVDDSIHRSSRWLPKAERVPNRPNNLGGGAGGGGGTGGGFFGSGLTLGNLFGWLLLVTILVTCVCLLLYAFSKAEIDLGGDTRPLGRANVTPDQQTLERMKHLPAELRRTDVNLRTEAERLMKEGAFDQAIILLFAHQLLLLDRAGMLRLNRGKTNGKYLRETRAVDRSVAEQLRATIAAFERSYFGRHEIDREDFAMLWSGNLNLEESVRRRQELAA